MSYPYSLPALPYDFGALEPHVDTQTMQIHHGKHHQAYVNNLNAALEKAPELQGKSLEELLRGIANAPDTVKGAVKNHGGGHQNHSLFWDVMGPGGGGEPAGELGAEIASTFGGFGALVEKLSGV